MPPKHETWIVVLRGKWGGSRAIRVKAKDAAQARIKARAMAQSHEQVSGVGKLA